jgi:hypothetical protein
VHQRVGWRRREGLLESADLEFVVCSVTAAVACLQLAGCAVALSIYISALRATAMSSQRAASAASCMQSRRMQSLYSVDAREALCWLFNRMQRPASVRYAASVFYQCGSSRKRGRLPADLHQGWPGDVLFVTSVIM